MKILKILTLLICLGVISHANTYKNISLLDYAEMVSHANQVEIFVNEDLVGKNISFFIQKDISPSQLLESFQYALEHKKLQLQKKGEIYYVLKEEIHQNQPLYENQKTFQGFQTALPIIQNGQEVDYTKLTTENYKKELIKRTSYFYDLEYLNYKDIDLLLKLHKNILYTYLPDSNSIVYFANDEEKAHIEALIKKYDTPKVQKSVKLTVFTTRLDKLQQIGSDLTNVGLSLENTLKLFGSFGATTTKNSANLYATINFLQEQGLTEINQSPTLLLRNGEKAIFNSVKNIPYLIQSKQVTDNQTSTQDSYEYKDIGLKITMQPKVFQDHMLVDFHLFIEDILTNEITPITSKIELKNTFDLKDDEVILISGLNRSEHVKNERKIPILGDIPYLGKAFKYNGVTNINEVTSIIIETIN
ncbi:MAG: hypothetical protein K0U47_12620 [Epsilonproteobacteria bacterium]|nr:hypothetical protein [Campylobacterota bacterium]